MLNVDAPSVSKRPSVAASVHSSALKRGPSHHASLYHNVNPIDFSSFGKITTMAAGRERQKRRQHDDPSVCVVFEVQHVCFPILVKAGTCLEIFSVHDIFYYDENGTFYPVSQIYYPQR